MNTSAGAPRKICGAKREVASKLNRTDIPPELSHALFEQAWDEALAAQRLLLEAAAEGGQATGYVYEELGECLLLRDKAGEARQWFRIAHEILSENDWLQANEAERLARLKELGQGS